ncbi:MAG TPA: MMPL family transporter [Myxococcaceae bacterium]|nr:MMPL family transporter [Myxococcaceae bacterium]
MKDSLPQRLAGAYARLIVRHPVAVLVILAVLALGSGWAASRLTINSNQLDLISQDLQEVKDVKRVTDMIGGAGHLIIGVRGDDLDQLKGVVDDLAARLAADGDVRTLTYKLPVEFIQEKMVLFIETEDLVEGKERINAYIKDQLRRANPFYIEIEETEPLKLELSDLTEKYTRVGKRSIADEYNVSNDGKMLLMIIKPMWEATELDKTAPYIEKLRAEFEAYSKDNGRGVTLTENYDPKSGADGALTFGFTGSYKMQLDDADAVKDSLAPVALLSFAGIVLILLLYFRKPVAVALVGVGMVTGTLFTMGFAWVTIGELNLITSILAGILMGLGEDFGVHFINRARLEFGEGQRYDAAMEGALTNNAVPAFISAIATSGSFYALMFSEFRGFSQFGFLAGFGIIITGLVLLSFKPALLVLIGRWKPELPAKLIGSTPPVNPNDAQGEERRVYNPKVVIAISTAVLVVLSLFAIPLPFGPDEAPAKGAPFWERIGAGVQFDYNTRALLPETQMAVKMNDEIAERYDMSADPIAVYTRTLDEAKKLYDELDPIDPVKYDTFDQVVSPFTFVPPPERAEANAAVLAEWREELSDIDPENLPPELQENAAIFFRMLNATPYDIDGLPQTYRAQFSHLETTRPENHGWLTYIYPQVDLWDGKNMMRFAAQSEHIITEDGTEFRSAGLPILYAKLAEIVLFDGRLTVALTAVWIFVVLLLDFRSLKYALAALLPLGLGMAVMMGLMGLFDIRLNFMNIVVLPVVLGYGVSHGVYLMHRFLEGTSPMVALRSVGAAVFFSTLTTVAGFAALMAADHNGIRSIGLVASLGLMTTLLVSFTLLAAVLQVFHDRREKRAKDPTQLPASEGQPPASSAAGG